MNGSDILNSTGMVKRTTLLIHLQKLHQVQLLLPSMSIYNLTFARADIEHFPTVQ